MHPRTGWNNRCPNANPAPRDTRGTIQASQRSIQLNVAQLFKSLYRRCSLGQSRELRGDLNIATSQSVSVDPIGQDRIPYETGSSDSRTRTIRGLVTKED